jgi:antitoxin ParD1/3/4
MSTTTMNISLPETLKRFVKERTKTANYSNPSDYVRALIREDQRRQAAEKLFEEMIAKHGPMSPARLEGLRAEYWSRWNELKVEIDKGFASFAHGEAKDANRSLAETVKRRGRERLANLKAR